MVHSYTHGCVKRLFINFLTKMSFLLHKLANPAVTSEKGGIRCTKIERARFPLYYTLRIYTAFSGSALSCDPVLGNPVVRFQLYA